MNQVYQNCALVCQAQTLFKDDLFVCLRTPTYLKFTIPSEERK